MKYFVAESIMENPLPCTPDELKTVYLPAHVEHLQGALKSGMLLVGGPNETGGGYLLLRSESREEVEAFLSRDPYQVHKLNHFILKEYFPTDRSEMVKDW